MFSIGVFNPKKPPVIFSVGETSTTAYNFLVASVASQTVLMMLTPRPLGVLKFEPVCRREGDWMSFTGRVFLAHLSIKIQI